MGSISSFISQNYYIKGGNIGVDRIEEAELVFLGETHTDESHTYLNASVISKLFKPGDWILTEGANRCSEKKSRHQGVQYLSKEKYFASGWDDISPENNELSKRISKIVSHLERGIAKKTTPKQALESLESAVNCFYKKEGLEDLQNELLALKNEKIEKTLPKSYYALVKKIMAVADHHIDTSLAADAFRRNRSMIKAIEHAFDQEKQKVFVTAGQAHLYMDENKETRSILGQARVEMVSVLDSYLKKTDKKYIILSPKSGIKTKEMEAELKYAKAGGKRMYFAKIVAKTAAKIAFLALFYIPMLLGIAIVMAAKYVVPMCVPLRKPKKMAEPKLLPYEIESHFEKIRKICDEKLNGQ